MPRDSCGLPRTKMCVVRAARPVTGFAAARLFRRVRISHHDLAHDGVFESAIRILVAGDADFAANIVAVRPLRCWLGLRSGSLRGSFRIAESLLGRGGAGGLLRRLLAGEGVKSREGK